MTSTHIRCLRALNNNAGEIIIIIGTCIAQTCKRNVTFKYYFVIIKNILEA